MLRTMTTSGVVLTWNFYAAFAHSKANAFDVAMATGVCFDLDVHSNGVDDFEFVLHQCVDALAALPGTTRVFRWNLHLLDLYLENGAFFRRIQFDVV